MSPSGMPAAGMAVSTGANARTGVMAAGGQGHAAGQLGDGRAVLVRAP